MFLLRLVLTVSLPLTAASARLKKETVEAFDSYIHKTEERLAQNRAKQFLWVDGSPERQAEARSGEVPTAALTGSDGLSVPGGIIHDWVGAVFAPGVKLDKALAIIQDYNNHKKFFGPEVVDSKLVSKNGNDYRIYLRLVKNKVLTVVLNTEHDARYFQLDATRWYSRSYSTRIAEVEHPGRSSERELPVGYDHGFLWRINSYWRFQERDGGVWIECQAVSLTRDIPTGLGWLISPIIRSLPGESLIHTLRSTREAVTSR